MPLFGSKFSPKKTPLRRSGNTSSDKLDDLIGAGKTVHLSLGDQQLLFENGEWITNSGKNSSVYKINKKLKKKNNDLEDEINLLKLKYEILLNMVTEMTAKIDTYERDMELQHTSQNIIKSSY